jgi:ribosomal protein S18 acetylase RimI-like enzyme
MEPVPQIYNKLSNNETTGLISNRYAKRPQMRSGNCGFAAQGAGLLFIGLIGRLARSLHKGKSAMEIRLATAADFDGIWPIFQQITSAGTTYAYARDTNKAGAQKIWMDAPRETWVAVDGGVIVGTYYIKANQAGGGAHVCNCGYMVASDAQGRGIARAMCEHSQVRAVELGFLAMQFNFVLATNLGAIGLWTKLGFEVVGRLPEAFDHPEAGFVDAVVMFKRLAKG